MFEGADIISGTAGPGLSEATGWIAQTMTGLLATITATLAIAALGFAMLKGRLSFKRGVRIVLGCFILFGAPFIARELMPVGRSIHYAGTENSARETPEVPTSPTTNPDPYAGASVPTQ